MAREKRSKIDLHPDRARIEREIALGKSVPQIARKYGLSDDSVYRHRDKLPPQLLAALSGKALRPGVDLAKLRIDESEGILSNLAVQRAKLLLAQDTAMEIENFGLVAQLSSQIHRNIDMVGRYLGEFASHQVKTNVSILIQPEYLELRTALVKALHPFPEARRAVAAVLHKIESVTSAPPVIEGVSNAA